MSSRHASFLRRLEVDQFHDADHELSVQARVNRIFGSGTEKIATLELASPFRGARLLPVRIEPLAPDEPVASHAYPNDRSRFAQGRFVQYSSDKLVGTALFELYDGDDRLVIDHGASGAPVLDARAGWWRSSATP